eukprot:scaffold6753_cov36-Cyclotella_meneghiniana.AAC.2
MASATANNQLKILLVGPVLGRLSHLSAKLSSLQNSKAGPFDVCFCAGPFFSTNKGDDDSAGDDDNDVIPSFVLPVVFVDEGNGIPPHFTNSSSNNNSDEEDEWKEVGGGQLHRLSSNLYHLTHQADILSLPIQHGSTAVSLTVGYCRSNVRIDSSACQSFKEKVRHTSYIGCDVLLSSEWGQGMERTLCNNNHHHHDVGVSQLFQEGSYDVAELVAMSRPRYHIAPGQEKEGLAVFAASPPYRYTSSSSSSSLSSHAGRFLALGHVTSPSQAKSLGKAYKYIHAVGITPLAYMNEVERIRAREDGVVVDNPYTDDSYQMVLSSNTTTTIATMDHHAQTISSSGGISEAHARRLIQQHSAQEQDYRWNTNNNKKRKHNSNEKEDELLQKEQANNPNNTSLFLHGLHRDAMGVLSYEVLMDAFRPFGCHTVRYPRSSNTGSSSSYVFLDFNSHDEALACLQKVKGEVAIRNVLLTLKWSNPTTTNNIYKHKNHHLSFLNWDTIICNVRFYIDHYKSQPLDIHPTL